MILEISRNSCVRAESLYFIHASEVKFDEEKYSRMKALCVTYLQSNELELVNVVVAIIFFLFHL